MPRVVSHADGSHNTSARVGSAGGNAVVVWKRTDGPDDSVWMSLSSAAGGDVWATPTRVDSAADPAGPITGAPVLAVSTNVFRTAVAWAKRANNVNLQPVIWARVYDSTPGGQLPPRIVSNDNGDPEVEPQLVIDRSPDRDIHLAWRQQGPGDQQPPAFSHIWVMRHDAQGWQARRLVSEPLGHAYRPKLVTNTTGFGFANTWLAWGETAPSSRVRVAHLQADEPAAPVTLSSPQLLYAARDEVNLVVDPMGNALSIWKDHGLSRLDSARYNALTGEWAAPMPVSGDSDLPASETVIGDLAVGRNGDIVAIWADVAGLHLRARRFE
jgi:hypothetical protein